MILHSNEPLCASLSLGTPEDAGTSFGSGTVLAPKRKLRPGYICVVWIIALSMSLAARAIDRDRRLDQLYHTTWTAKDGAPGHVRALAQTTDGYLWVGSTIGLFRFDGLHRENYEPPSGTMLPSTSVKSLLADPDGIWPKRLREAMAPAAAETPATAMNFRRLSPLKLVPIISDLPFLTFHKPSALSPGNWSGRLPCGQRNFRSFAVMAKSLMLAWRARMRPSSSNSQFSFPYARNQSPEASRYSYANRTAIRLS